MMKMKKMMMMEAICRALTIGQTRKYFSCTKHTFHCYCHCRQEVLLVSPFYR